MALKLAKNENIIKTWTYSSMKKRNLETNCDIVLTNKRFLLQGKNEHQLASKEIALDRITRFETGLAKSPIVKAVMMIVFGVTLMLLGVVGLIALKDYFTYLQILILVPILIAVGGLSLLISGIINLVKCLKSKAFYLVVYTKPDMLFAKVSAGFTIVSDYFAAGKVKIIVNYDTCKEIVDELGSYLIEAPTMKTTTTEPIKPMPRPMPTIKPVEPVNTNKGE